MVTWDIRRDGRAWGGEAMSRYQMTPEKTEMLDGRLYGTEEERQTMAQRSPPRPSAASIVSRDRSPRNRQGVRNI